MAVVLAVVVAGCGGRLLTPSSGVVSGTLAIYGGPSGSGPLPEAGTVRLTDVLGQRTDVHVGATGTFSARVPAGRYTVVAGVRPPPDWPMGSCNALWHSGHYDRSNHSYYIVVREGHRLHIHVACIAL